MFLSYRVTEDICIDLKNTEEKILLLTNVENQFPEMLGCNSTAHIA